MDTIVTTAIVGTGQQSDTLIATGTPIDALASQLSGDDVERRLLLTAGAWSIYQRAGYIAEPAPESPEAAPPEQLRPCSPQAASLLTRLFQGEHNELLPEALALLKLANLRLPHALLPQALDYGRQNEAMRVALMPVLGERGRWLAQFNSDWSWITQLLLATEATLPPDAENIWQEGTLGERDKVLQLLRRVDPGRARDWLADAWKHEKANARARLLKVLETNLSLEDESFIEEKALGDRSESVRTTAASLLLRLPASRLSQRMLARADALLAYARGTFPLSKSQLSITMPNQLDQAWLHDSPLDYPSQDKEEQTHYLLATIAFIPPKHWEERFAATASEILAAAHTNRSYRKLIEAWSRAALFHNDITWVQPLLHEYHSFLEKTAQPNLDLYKELLSRLSQQEAEEIFLQKLLNTSFWTQVLSALPSPWTHSFGIELLQALKLHFRKLAADIHITNNLYPTFQQAAISLAPSCFELTLDGWQFPEGESWQTQYWRKQLDDFTDTIRMRKQVVDELIVIEYTQQLC